LINARNSNVVLRGCQFSGSSQQESEQNSGLIQWAMTDTDSISVKGELPFLSINDSFLMSNGIGIRTEHSKGNVFLRNCIVASRGYGISVFPSRSSANPTIDLEHVTFSASKAALRVEASAESATTGSPVKIFIESCAVVPPIEMKAGEADESTVLEFSDASGNQKQIEWWGSSNGFANELHSFLRRPNTEPVNTVAGWEAVWGDSAAVRLLTGPKGVQLLRPLPAKWNNIKPSSFALDPDSQSAKWGPGSTMIGARIQQIEEATTLKKVSKEVKSGTPNTKKAVGSGNSF
jgi:hypothetical protein